MHETALNTTSWSPLRHFQLVEEAALLHHQGLQPPAHPQKRVQQLLHCYQAWKCWKIIMKNHQLIHFKRPTDLQWTLLKGWVWLDLTFCQEHTVPLLVLSPLPPINYFFLQSLLKFSDDHMNSSTIAKLWQLLQTKALSSRGIQDSSVCCMQWRWMTEIPNYPCAGLTETFLLTTHYKHSV